MRERLVSQRTGIINQIRAFLLERGIAVRQGLRFLRVELPRLLATPPDVLSPRTVGVIERLAEDWRRLDQRIEQLSGEITALAHQDAGCKRLVSVPGIGPIISSAMVAAIGTGDAFSKGRDFAARLGLVPKQISTGDRTILGKISKRGDRYLRVLFVQAAWVVVLLYAFRFTSGPCSKSQRTAISRSERSSAMTLVLVLIAQSMRGFEVALSRCFQSAGPIFGRNGRDELSDPWNSSDCRRKNLVFVQR